jgi:ATP-dependent DNA helicase RecG
MNIDSLIEENFQLKKEQKKALERLGIKTCRDLLFHFPTRYNDISEIKNIAELKEGDDTVVYGKILSIKTSKAYRKKIPLTEAIIKDSTGKIKAVWFHQAYIAKMLPTGSFVKLKGKVTKKGETIYLANPEFEKTKELPIDSADSLFAAHNKKQSFFYPIYPESKGVTSRWFYHHILEVLKKSNLDEIKDPIPENILKKYSLPKLKTAIIWIHNPQKQSDSVAARKRFAFEEIFFIQLERQKSRSEYEENPSFSIDVSKKDISDFVSRFPFNLTVAQKNAIKQILSDIKSNKPMSRLLEGDVGSGKTAVATTIAYAVISTHPKGQSFGNLQVAYMAPTEILAKQHFQSFIEYFKHIPVHIGLITGSGCKKFPSKVNPSEVTNISRAQLLRWVANGEIPILIGTHSLIQKTVGFENLALVIIDEQHRFGTAQRMKLVHKDKIAPHLLSMTATPIPRTLALTIYGDLDLTLLDQMPTGRKQIVTDIVLPAQREKVYKKVRKELENGRQMYVICPRIDEPNPDKALALNVRSVKTEAKQLKKDIFPEYEIDILHSKMKPKEKEETMQKFAEGKINILVATSVVEVGVNVPNATVIVIEGAERFGLAQLHQLRGRVLRSNHQTYCFIFSDTENKRSIERLKALKTAKNGFELSELDLNLRGAGELSGKKQWGISDLGMEAIKNIKMVGAARTQARKLIKEDPKLNNNPTIKTRLNSTNSEIHFE